MPTPDEAQPAAGERPLSCPEMVELLTAYLDGALSARDAETFEAHLALCPGCVTYLEQFRETIDAAGTLREDDVDEATMSELLGAFRGWLASRK